MDTCSTYGHGITCVADCPAGTFKEQAIMSCLGCSYVIYIFDHLEMQNMFCH